MNHVADKAECFRSAATKRLHRKKNRKNDISFNMQIGILNERLKDDFFSSSVLCDR